MGRLLSPSCNLNGAKISILFQTSKLFRKKVTYKGKKNYLLNSCFIISSISFVSWSAALFIALGAS